MNVNYFETDDKLISSQIDDASRHTEDTFQAFVDAVVPRSPELAEEYGKIQYFGALDLHTDEYMVLSLNSYYIPLAEAMAEALDIASEQLTVLDGDNQLFRMSPEGVMFASLDPIDRFRALTLLEQNQLYFAELMAPLLNDPGLILSAMGMLNRFTMMGYYSEWSGYGSTRLDAPDRRRLEFYPLSWKQVGYPGPSLGYRALRT